MKTLKTILFVAAFAAATVFTGCTEDMITDMSSIQLSFEDFNGGGDKAYINGNFACWENGDAIKLSRKRGNYESFTGSISITYPSGAPVASASAGSFSTQADDWVFCGYPSANFTTDIMYSGTSVTLANIYTYSETNGKQFIECPMVGGMIVKGYPEGEPNPNVLKMYNLCSMLKIKLDKPSTGAYTVDSIVVINQTNSSPMYGSGYLTFETNVGDDGITRYVPTLHMNEIPGFVQDRVVLNLKSNPVAINATKYFYIPIPPQAANQDFKILIHNKLTGKWMYNTIHSNMAIPGNSIATIQGPSTEEPLPAPYEFYDYLVNNNGSSKIDLGVAPNNNMKMEITFSVPDGYMSGSQYYTGSRPGDANTQIYFGLSASVNDSKFRAHFCSYPQGNGTGANYVMSDMDRQAGKKYRQTIEVQQHPTNTTQYRAAVTFERLDNNGNTVAIETKYSGYKEGGIPEGATDICVFSLGQVNQPRMKLYSYRIWSGQTLLHNFVPAKSTSTGNSGVYDMSTSQFIEGTGSFTANNE